MNKKEMRNINKKETMATISIARSYGNAGIQKQQICTDNNNKTGIYR